MPPGRIRPALDRTLGGTRHADVAAVGARAEHELVRRAARALCDDASTTPKPPSVASPAQVGKRRREARVRIRDAERTADHETVEHDPVQPAPDIVVLVGRPLNADWKAGPASLSSASCRLLSIT